MIRPIRDLEITLGNRRLNRIRTNQNGISYNSNVMQSAPTLCNWDGRKREAKLFKFPIKMRDAPLALSLFLT